MVNDLVIDVDDGVTVGSTKSMSNVVNANNNHSNANVVSTSATSATTTTTTTAIRSTNSIHQPVAVISSLNSTPFNGSHYNSQRLAVAIRNNYRPNAIHSSSLLHTNICKQQTTTNITTTTSNAEKDGNRNVNPNVNSTLLSSPSVIPFRPINYILLNKLRVQKPQLRRLCVGRTSSSSSKLTINKSNTSTERQYQQQPSKTKLVNNVMEPNNGQQKLVSSRSTTFNNNRQTVSSSYVPSQHRLSLCNTVVPATGHPRPNPRPIINRINATYWLNAHKKDSSSKTNSKVETKLWYPSTASSFPSSSSPKEEQQQSLHSTGKSNLKSKQQSKSLTNNQMNVNYSIHVAQSKPEHHQNENSCQTNSSQNDSNESSITKVSNSGIVCFQASTMNNNSNNNNAKDYSLLSSSNIIQVKSKSVINDRIILIDSDPRSKPLNKQNDLSTTTVTTAAVFHTDDKMNQLVQCDKMIRVNTETDINVDRNPKCNIKTGENVSGQKLKTNNLNSSKQIKSLLKFIEKSSSEFIFLLDKSANLSYQMALFERKLDYLERIFNNNRNNEKNVYNNNEESILWSKVINRTRGWITKSRQKNIFITNFELKSDIVGKQFKSKQQILDEWKNLTNEKKNNSNNTFIETITPTINEGMMMNVSSYSSLTSKDELIVLLERIAQFSSNIISQRKPLKHKYLQRSQEFHDVNDVSKDELKEANKCIVSDSNSQYEENQLRSSISLNENIDPKVFFNEILDSDLDCNQNRKLIEHLQPEILKALIQLVKTNSFLVQVQRQFDILMCEHLKSFSQLLNKNKNSRNDNSSNNIENQFMGTSLPLSLNIGNQSKRFNVRLNRLPNNQLSTLTPMKQQFMKHNNSNTMNNVIKHSTINHCCKNSSKLHEEVTTATTFGEYNKLQHCTNFVSDGDSGGEFTATTVTNEFNQCVTDDELSSLLNQIALCSQKIIEQSNTTTTGVSSNNSTSSSGCCCSTSIETKCTGTCSINHHHPQQQQPLQSSNSKPKIVTHSWSNEQDQCYCNNDMERFHLNSNSRNNDCCHPINSKSNTAICSNNNNNNNNTNTTMSFNNHLNRMSIDEQQQQQKQCHNNSSNLNQCKKQTHNFNHHYSDVKRNVIMPKRSDSAVNFIGWPLDEPLMDRVSNNMTGFMLSSSTFDMMAPHEQQHHCSRRHFNKHHQHQYKMEKCIPYTEQHYINTGSNTTTTSAFIFDPNVDVESFLNEVEKELDENRFTSAPPFMNPETNYESAPNNYHQIRRGSHRCSSIQTRSRENRTTDEQSFCCQQQPILESIPKCDPILSSYSFSPLVTVIASNTIAPTTLMSSIHSENGHHNKCSSRFSDINHHQSLILAGGNWKLSQRNSINDFGRFNISMANSQYSSTMASFIANGSIPSSGVDPQQQKIYPVSRDLLDKYRSQISYQVNEETDRQLKEIDQWLYRHLKQIRTEAERDTQQTKANTDLNNGNDNDENKSDKLSFIN